MTLHAIRALYYHIPEPVRHGILVLRRNALWLRTGVVFIHIPKAAGTSINQALYGRFMGHMRASDVERSASADVKALPIFAVTRNPWDRLLSAYRFARRGRGVGGAQQAWVWRPYQYQVPECETFERFVHEWLAPRDVSKVDGIFQLQSSFVCDLAGELIVDHAGRLDDLTPTIDFIAKAIGRRPDIPISNTSGENVDYRRFYSPELVEAVARIYAPDIERFGYSFER